MSAFETPADRQGFKVIVENKMRELRAALASATDDTFTPGSELYPYACILVAGIVGVVNEDAIAEGMEFDLDFVRTVGSRLRASFVWTDDQYSAEHQLHEEGGGTAFFLHVAVAKGQIQMREDGRFRMTETGKKDIEALMKRKGG